VVVNLFVCGMEGWEVKCGFAVCFLINMGGACSAYGGDERRILVLRGET
jgi:hypothetical protein